MHHPLQVSAELHATVQRLYVETLGRLDNALTTICGHFDAQRYSMVRRKAEGLVQEKRVLVG